MTPTEEHYERLLAEVCRERERYNGMHQIAVMEIERLRGALGHVTELLVDTWKHPMDGDPEHQMAVQEGRSALARLVP